MQEWGTQFAPNLLVEEQVPGAKIGANWLQLLAQLTHSRSLQSRQYWSGRPSIFFKPHGSTTPCTLVGYPWLVGPGTVAPSNLRRPSLAYWSGQSSIFLLVVNRRLTKWKETQSAVFFVYKQLFISNAVAQ